MQKPLTYTDKNFRLSYDYGLLEQVSWINLPDTDVLLQPTTHGNIVALQHTGFAGPSGYPALWWKDYNVANDSYMIAIYDSKGNELHVMEIKDGLHRRTNQAISSGAVAVTSNTTSIGTSTPGTITTSPGTLAAIAYQQAYQIARQAAISNSVNSISYVSGSIPPYQGYQQYIVPQGGGVTVSHITYNEYGDIKNIKHEGLRAGEIIGYRCWPIKHGFLWSTAADRAWAPGEPMAAEEGHLEQGFGVYSFKEMSRVIKDFSGANGLEGIAFGSVYLWGEIVEHKIGYRSQYASVRSIEFVRGVPPQDWTPDFVDNIKKLYRVENPDASIATITLWPESGEDDRAVGR